jgi:RNA polymerase sigma-70 factor (sigma-E family)
MATLPLLLESGVHPLVAVGVADRAEETVEGDEAVEYEASFACLHRRAYDVAYKLLGSRPEAEDVAQEALARAFVHWSSIHSYAEPWTVRVAANLAVGTWRKRRRLSDLPPEGVERTQGHPQHAVADHLELRRALTRLSRRQREVVVLRHLAGFTERETAQALGCSDGTVKQHAARGLASLRRQLVTDDESGAETTAPPDPGPRPVLRARLR